LVCELAQGRSLEIGKPGLENIAKHQTRHGKQKKPRSSTKKHHPQTVQKKRINNRKKTRTKTRKRNTKKTRKKTKQLKSTILASG